METAIYVTYREKSIKGIKYYAVKCKDNEQAYDIALDVYSLASTSYVKINRCGKFKHKNIIMLTAEKYKKNR